MRSLARQFRILCRVALASVLLVGCGAQPLLQPAAQPSPQFLRLQVNNVTDDGVLGSPTLVVAIPDGEDWRWLWTDTLGMPLARETLHDGSWQADGLLPPNRVAQPLFNALAVLALDEMSREKVFPDLALISDSTNDDEVTFALMDHKQQAYPQFSFACQPTGQPRSQHKAPDSLDDSACNNDKMMLNIYSIRSHYQLRKLR